MNLRAAPCQDPSNLSVAPDVDQELDKMCDMLYESLTKLPDRRVFLLAISYTLASLSYPPISCVLASELWRPARTTHAQSSLLKCMRLDRLHCSHVDLRALREKCLEILGKRVSFIYFGWILCIGKNIEPFF